MTEPKPPSRVLVVDDDTLLLDMIKSGLERSGYEVSACVNGKEALGMLTRQRFDLVVLDVMMPYVDGYHVAHEITQMLGGNAPKVLLITGRDTSRESGVILMSGADAAIQKPFDFGDLLSKVQQLLGGAAKD